MVDNCRNASPYSTDSPDRERRHAAALGRQQVPTNMVAMRGSLCQSKARSQSSTDAAYHGGCLFVF